MTQARSTITVVDSTSTHQEQKLLPVITGHCDAPNSTIPPTEAIRCEFHQDDLVTTLIDGVSDQAQAKKWLETFNFQALFEKAKQKLAAGSSISTEWLAENQQIVEGQIAKLQSPNKEFEQQLQTAQIVFTAVLTDA